MGLPFMPKTLKMLTQALIFGICVAIGGCNGTESREAAENTVEEMAGKKDLDRYRQMKDDLGEIEKQQEDKYRQLDE